MWNESSASLAQSSLNNDVVSNNLLPAVIANVQPGSIGELLGFENGDKLISVNGTKPRDLIDYQFLIVEEELTLEILGINGEKHLVEIEKDLDQGLGIEFTESLFNGLKQCNNKCPFCFIDQQPKGKRETLYLKDDDYRLSFLYGSYLTLTNLKDSDWERIEQQRLSPLYVSVHSTNPALRAKLLKNPRATQLLKQIRWFAKRNLQIHTQIVVCPGLNDGEALKKSLIDLSNFRKGEWPCVISAAVVPVGLTKFRPPNDGLIAVDKKCAIEVIEEVEKLQKIFKAKFGSRFAWLADEWYLIAHQALPKRNIYEDLPQQENGVGSIRAFLESMNYATQKLPSKIKSPKTFSWVVGKLVENALIPICHKLNQIQGLTVYLHGLPSPYWGQENVVTGLLTGQDLLEGLKATNLGDELLLPKVMLKEEQKIFLDDMTILEISDKLGVSIRVVDGADQIVAALLEDQR